MKFSNELKQLLLLCILLISETIEDDQGEYSNEDSNGNGPIDKLTKESCMSRRTECCVQLDLGEVSSFTKCMHQDKMPDKNEKDPRKLVKFVSCVVECTYKEKNYIGPGDKLNMTMIRHDAGKMFTSNTKKRDYYIVMYNYCYNHGRATYNNIKSNPAARLMLMDACNPQLLFIYMCTTDYHKHHECPYFKWEGKSGTAEESNCAKAQEKCSQIDNISEK